MFVRGCVTCTHTVTAGPVSPFTERLLGKMNLLPSICPKHQHLLFCIDDTLQQYDKQTQKNNDDDTLKSKAPPAKKKQTIQLSEDLKETFSEDYLP